MKRPTLAQNLHPIMGRRSVASSYFTIAVLQYLKPILQGVPIFHQDAPVHDEPGCCGQGSAHCPQDSLSWPVRGWTQPRLVHSSGHLQPQVSLQSGRSGGQSSGEVLHSLFGCKGNYLLSKFGWGKRRLYLNQFNCVFDMVKVWKIWHDHHSSHWMGGGMA